LISLTLLLEYIFPVLPQDNYISTRDLPVVILDKNETRKSAGKFIHSDQMVAKIENRQMAVAVFVFNKSCRRVDVA